MSIAETCDDNNPLPLITGVAVNGANESDQAPLVPMVDRLAERGLAPAELCADTGYGSGRNLVECAERAIDLRAPVHAPAAPPAIDAFVAAGESERGVPTAAAAAEPATGAAPDATAAEPIPGAAPETAPLDDGRVRLPLPDRLDLASFAFNSAFSEVLSCPAGRAPAAQHLANGVLIATFAAAQRRGCPRSTRCPIRELADGSRPLRRAPATIATEVRQHEQRTRGFNVRAASRIATGPAAASSRRTAP